MNPVVAEAAVDRIGVTVGPGVGRAADGEIDRLLDEAGDVHDRAGPWPRQADGRLSRGGDPVERLGQTVAADLDEAVVAEDAVFAGAAENLVQSGAADEVVVPGVAVEYVVADLTVGEVVAVFAVDQVGAADVRCAGDAGRVVEQPVGVRDDSLRTARLRRARTRGVGADVRRRIVDEAQEAARRHQSEQVAVVAEDGVGVAGMVGECPRGGVRPRAEQVRGQTGAGPTEEDVATVGPLGRRRQAEQRGTAADDVVLPETAEDHVVAAAALDVVVAVACRFRRRRHQQRAIGQTSGTHRVGDRAVALDDIVPQFAEDLVVAGTAREDIVAGRARQRGIRVIEQRDLPVQRAGRVVLRREARVDRARGVVNRRRVRGDEARAERVEPPPHDGVVSGDDIVPGAAVDPIVAVLGTGHVAAAEQVVVAAAAQDGVVTLLAHDHIIARAGVDKVVVRVALQVGVLRQDRREVEHAAEVEGAWRQLEVGHDGHGQNGGVNPAVGTEHQVVPAAAGHDVVAGPAADDVAARAVRDAIGPVGAGLDGDQRAELERVGRERRARVVANGRGERAAVAEHEALPITRGDHVGPGPTEDDVVAGTRRDGVAATGVHLDRVRTAGGDRVDVACIVVGRHIVEIAVVAEYDVVAVRPARRLADVGGDGIVPETAQDDVPADAGADRVIAPDQRADRLDPAQRDVEVVERLG